MTALSTLPTRTAAQDTHYWSQRYGAQAELLAGAVVGSILDLSATYYNPGALALMRDPSVLLSARAFEYYTLSLRDSTGGRTALSTDSFGPAPSLFATLIPIGTGRIAFTALTRQDFDVRTEARSTWIRDVPTAGPTEITGEFLVDQDMTEMWFGVTWARRERERVGFGVTPYVVYRGQRTRIQMLANSADTLGSLATSTAVDDFRYSHYRLLLKAGVSWIVDDDLTVGFNLTTPSIGIGFVSSGTAHVNRTIINQDIDGDGEPDDFAYVETEDGIDAHYKSPLSIAAGLSYRTGRATIHTTMEWFNSVTKYDVLRASNIPEGPPGVTITQRLSQELRSVINFGIGTELDINDTWNGYASFATDFTAAKKNSTSKHSLSRWDLYHVTTGAALTVQGLDVTLGLDYTFGSDKVRPPGDAFIGDNVLEPELWNGTMRYRAWKLIVGFAFTV